jgi:hypothetical protein
MSEYTEDDVVEAMHAVVEAVLRDIDAHNWKMAERRLRKALITLDLALKGVA